MQLSMDSETVERIVQFSDTCWGWTEGVEGSWRTYYRDELKLLAESALRSVPTGGNMLEVGTFGGLSTSVLLQVGRERKAKLWACDPFHWVGEKARPQLYQILRQFADVDTIFQEQTSEEFYQDVAMSIGPHKLDFIHIDGNHDKPAVELDCKLWLPLLRQGGIACFHDYHKGCESMHGLMEAVDAATEGWEQIGLVGTHWVLARRKP